ncbi:MAG TPA: HAMP domain-containing sensor histidine kinase [Cyclobacteriaceae bacterium]|nr:HAMP domain-containing sensor histidine kinase [Cyclobacteriaceae bacterium]
MKPFLRNLILGPGKFIEDYSLYRRALLLGYLELLTICIATFYFLMDMLNGINSGNLPYLIIVVVSLGALYLTRLGYYTAATIIQLIMVDAIVFYFSLYDKRHTVDLFFISNALASFVLLGYHNRLLSIAAVLFTLSLLIISFTGTFGYFPKDLNMYMFFNFIFVFIICVIILYYALRIHHHSEKITKAKNEQLQKANAELDRFVYSASHDLRAPLSSLLGLIELTRKTDDRKEIDNYLTMMKGRIHHLDDFIREIIDYSRNERMEVIRQPVNLHQLVAETTLDLKHLDGAESIDIRNEVPPDTFLPSDAMRLKIVMNNLMNNAIKYHDRNKENRFIRISVTPGQPGTHFSVCDNGMGIPTEHHDKVFNMFYRASDKSKGSGLGLYIVKQSLGQLGGSITLKSQLGEGSTFTISIPS